MRHSPDILTINRLGHLGDGIAERGGETVIVPRALPGETAALDEDGGFEILTPSSQRVTPPCPHFAVCGGCTLQHLAAEPYLAWKRALVVDALARQGIDTKVDACRPCAPASRRRATFQGGQQDGAYVFGHARRRSHELVGIAQCPILTPELEQALPLLAAVASTISGGTSCRMQVTAAENGLDIVLHQDQRVADERLKAATRKLAEGPVIRAEVNGVALIEKAVPRTNLGGRLVDLPGEAFLQAVESVQETMIDLVQSHLRKSKRVADLFCGLGTFALPLAERATVVAADNAGSSLAGLTKATGQDGLKPIKVHQRDLIGEPMRHDELKGLDGAVIDPPRSGALAQSQQVAKSGISKLAMVSCNPETLARDLKVLVDAGFAIERVIPLDQFLWSPHVEVVALLSRKAADRERKIFGRKV